MDKIIEKIKKILALSKSGNENEAAVALEKARQLMERHGISERDVELSSVGKASINIGNTAIPPAYICHLVALIGRVFGVRHVFIPEYTVRGFRISVDFIGIDAAAEIAVYATDVLKRQLVRGRKDYLKTIKRVKRSTKTRRADLWAQAWCRAVERKVRVMALPSMQQKLIEDWKIAHYKSLEKFKPNQAVNRGRGDNIAILAGAVAGNNVNLHPGVGSPDGVGLIS